MRVPVPPAYHDATQFAKEQALCRQLAYLTHRQALPETGAWCTIDWQQHATLVIRDGEQFRKLGNICRHRQARIVHGHGLSRRLFCPVHRWAYELDGRFYKAPHIPDCPQRNLPSATVYEREGLLFENPPPAFALHPPAGDERLSLEGYRFHSVTHTDYDFHWRHFLEIYLENYHVTPMHPGLTQFIDPHDLEWVLAPTHSIQKVGFSRRIRPDPDSPEIYDRLAHELSQLDGQMPRHATLWSLIYPNLMVESYPHVRVISTVWPISPDRCRNTVEIYVDPEMERARPRYLELFLEAYAETALEDESACRMLHEGRKALEQMGQQDDTVYAPHLENGVRAFYEWLNSATFEKGG